MDPFRVRPPVSPMGAMLRSLLLPGWGQSVLNRRGTGAFFVLFPVPALLSGSLALVVLYFTGSITRTLAFFLILLPILLVWPFDYSYSLIGYVVGLPILVGITHFLSVRRLASLEPETD